MTGIVISCVLSSLLRLILSVLLSTRDNSKEEGVDYAVMLYCIPNHTASYILIYTHLLRFCNNTHDILRGEHCSHHWLVRGGYCDALVAFMESFMITAERGVCGAAGCADALPRRFADSEGRGPPGEDNKASMIRITLYGARSARVQ